MNLKKRVFGGALALALGASLAVPALAAGTHDPSDPNDRPVIDGTDRPGNQSIISIIEIEKDPGQVSVEVPLYITLAAPYGTAKALVPTNYGITNTTQPNAANADEFLGIAVKTIEFSRVQGASWSTVADAPTTEPKDICLKIGDLLMPTVNATTPKETLGTADGATTNAFYDANATGTGTALGYTIVAPGNSLALPIDAAIANVNTGRNGTGTNAVAQFKIVYTIGLVDKDHNFVGTPYAGDFYVDAQLDAGQYTGWDLLAPAAPGNPDP